MLPRSMMIKIEALLLLNDVSTFNYDCGTGSIVLSILWKIMWHLKSTQRLLNSWNKLGKIRSETFYNAKVMFIIGIVLRLQSVFAYNHEMILKFSFCYLSRQWLCVDDMADEYYIVALLFFINLEIVENNIYELLYTVLG